MAMKDMNIAKLTSPDLPLFNGITQDLFPLVEVPSIDYDQVGKPQSETLLLNLSESEYINKKNDFMASFCPKLKSLANVWCHCSATFLHSLKLESDC